MSPAREDSAVRIARAVLEVGKLNRARNPEFKLTLHDLADAMRPALDREFPAEKNRRRVNGRDLLFDAIATACDRDLTAPFTRGEGAAFATAKRDILEAMPEVTPEEIARRAKLYLAKYKLPHCTPAGLAKHFNEFAPRSQRTTEPTAPKGWLAKLNELFPDSTMARGGMFEVKTESEYEWTRLDKMVRQKITDALK